MSVCAFTSIHSIHFNRHLSLMSTEPLVLEKEVEGREEGGEGEGGVDEGQESSCQVIPGEEAEVRPHPPHHHEGRLATDT